MPPSSLPTASDLPSAFEPVLHPANLSLTQVSNIIVFLPGLGDTSKNFAGFARALNLPETLALTLQPPSPLPVPIGPGFHWSDDLLFDQATGALDPDSGFARVARLLAEDVISKILLKKCGFKPAEIHLFGFGQGGSAALAAALHPSISSLSLGSLTSIGGAVPLSTPLPSTDVHKNRTPVLLLGGSRGALTAQEQSLVKRTKNSYTFVEYHQWKKADDSLPKSREEALPMMQFFGRRLRSRKGVPDGATEIG